MSEMSIDTSKVKTMGEFKTAIADAVEEYLNKKIQGNHKIGAQTVIIERTTADESVTACTISLPENGIPHFALITVHSNSTVGTGVIIIIHNDDGSYSITVPSADIGYYVSRLATGLTRRHFIDTKSINVSSTSVSFNIKGNKVEGSIDPGTYLVDYHIW